MVDAELRMLMLISAAETGQMSAAETGQTCLLLRQDEYQLLEQGELCFNTLHSSCLNCSIRCVSEADICLVAAIHISINIHH